MYQRLCAALAVTAVVSTAAIAAGPLQIVSKVLAEQRVRAGDGSTSVVLGVAKRAVPGDRIVIILEYRNTGRQPLSGLVLNNPVPQGVAYRGPAPSSPNARGFDRRRHLWLASVPASPHADRRAGGEPRRCHRGAVATCGPPGGRRARQTSISGRPQVTERSVEFPPFWSNI